MFSIIKPKIILDPTLQNAWQGQDIFQLVFSLSGKIYRQEKNRKTLRFELNGKHYFIKLHTGIGWKEICKNLLQGKLPVLGAGQEWRAIQRLNALKIPTMHLVGYGQKGFNPAKRCSFVITEELTDTISLEDFCQIWQKQPPLPRLKWRLIAEVARIARVLHTNGVNHRDFYICHFLKNTKNIGEALQLYLIDLHRVQLRNVTPKRWIIKDIAGLYFSTFEIGLTRRDLLRFMKIYSAKSLANTLREDKGFWLEVRERAKKLYAKEIAKK